MPCRRHRCKQRIHRGAICTHVRPQGAAEVGSARSGRWRWWAARDPATGSDHGCPGRPPNPLFADLHSSRAIANVRIRAA
uniref:Uncharacterized protein n=1 Tax=Setaria italica TaxID=4555 RepID=K4AJ42_SETIT